MVLLSLWWRLLHLLLPSPRHAPDDGLCDLADHPDVIYLAAGPPQLRDVHGGNLGRDADHPRTSTNGEGDDRAVEQLPCSGLLDGELLRARRVSVAASA